MGGCYSTSSQSAATSPVYKRPRLRGSKRSKKQTQYSPVNGRDVRHDHSPEISSNGKSISVEEDLERVNTGMKAVIKEEKGVAPSDSGIESLEFPKEELDQKLMINNDQSESVTPNKSLKEESVVNRDYTLCRSCHTNLQRISRGLCKRCGHFRIDPSGLLGLVDTENETYCTCGPRQLGKASTCRTHGGRTSSVPAYRLSNLSGSKPNIKEEKRSGGESNHIGSDAVNLCVDGAEKGDASSESEVLLRYPSSPKGHVTNRCLSEKVDEHFECDGAFLASKINACWEALDCICKCDHHSDSVQDLCGKVSGPELFAAYIDGDQTYIKGSLFELLLHPVLKGSPSRLPVVDGERRVCLASVKDDDDDSGRGVSKSENRSESTSDLEIGQRTGAESSNVSEQSSPYRLAAEKAMESLSDPSEDVVCPVTVNGREMVMINASTYNCMLNDLAMLKEQLYDLTILIQEEGTESVSHLNLSLQTDQ